MKSFREMCEILDEIAVGSGFSVPEPKTFRPSKGLAPDVGEHRIIPVVLHSMVVRQILTNYVGLSERPARDLLERMLKTDGSGGPMLVVYASNVEVDSLRRMADDLSDTGDDVFALCAKSIRDSLGEGAKWYSKKTGEME